MHDNTEIQPNRPSNLFLPISQLTPDPHNVRGKLHGIDELAASITVHGVIQPLVVCPDGDGAYRIIAGHRRFEAAKLARSDSVPVTIREQADGARSVQLVENVQREDLAAIEVAEALEQLMEQHEGDSVAVGKQVGKSQSWVRRHLSLLRVDKKLVTAMRRQGLGLEQAARATQVFKVEGIVAGLEAIEQLATGQMRTKSERPTVRVEAFAHKRRFRSPQTDFHAEIVLETRDELDEVKIGQVQSIMTALERVLGAA